MTKELTRMELAACKRVAANTKSLKTKLAKLTSKIEELKDQQVVYLEEIRMWEAPIMEKYGYSVDEILDGSYLKSPSVEDVISIADKMWVTEANPVEEVRESFDGERMPKDYQPMCNVPYEDTSYITEQ